MKWWCAAVLLRAASLANREPERSALAELAGELAQLDAGAAPVSSR